MGYFSNGTEGDFYEDRYCSKCIHFMDCAIWDAHMLHNYDECNKEDSILHILIPRSKDGLDNEKCRMFMEGKSPAVEREKELARIRNNINPVFKDWAKQRGLI